MTNVIIPKKHYKVPQRRIKLHSVTAYFAKKRLIQEALIYFHDQPDERSVIIESKSEDIPIIIKNVKQNKLQRAVGYDFTKQWEKLCADKNLVGVENILKVFDQL